MSRRYVDDRLIVCPIKIGVTDSDPGTPAIVPVVHGAGFVYALGSIVAVFAIRGCWLEESGVSETMEPALVTGRGIL